MNRNQERRKEDLRDLKGKISAQLLAAAVIALGKKAAENVHFTIVVENGQVKLVLAFGPPAAAADTSPSGAVASQTTWSPAFSGA